MKSGQIPYFLAWHRAINLTFNRFNLLQKTFQGDWKKSWETADKFFLELDFDGKFKERLSLRAKVSPQKEYNLLQNCGAKIITTDESDFPLPLKHIPNPPPFLFFRGEFSLQDFPALAVVGSRKLSAYGKQAMTELLSPLTNLGVTIVSGLALGTDAEAHRLALQGNSRTIAVLGSGIDQITPQANFHLGERILQENRGAIISEYLPNTETQAVFSPSEIGLFRDYLELF
jgi:DNA processing protein